MTPVLILSFAKIHQTTQTTKPRKKTKNIKVKPRFCSSGRKTKLRGTKTKEKREYARKKGSENKTAEKQQHKPLFMQRRQQGAYLLTSSGSPRCPEEGVNLKKPAYSSSSPSTSCMV
ncbi:hypothetical protein [Photobacterium kasasachensis]|uniref:hypothetical protein n=1 Tax=Photobacterium kasasachensis TaxID=2910240 RepID=UPI003D1512D2